MILRRIAAVSLFLLVCTIALWAGSTPTLPCGTSADVVLAGGVAWTNPGNACIVGQATVATITPLGHSDYLAATNFSFAVPGGATVLGVQMSFYRLGGLGGVIADQGVYLTKNGTVVTGTNHANFNFWTSAGAFQAYGGTSDLWGATLAPADVNAATFGVFIEAGNFNNAQSFNAAIGQTGASNPDGRVIMTVTYSSQSTGFSPGIIGTFVQARTAGLFKP